MDIRVSFDNHDSVFQQHLGSQGPTGEFVAFLGRDFSRSNSFFGTIVVLSLYWRV
jgi:hypothetical protein